MPSRSRGDTLCSIRPGVARLLVAFCALFFWALPKSHAAPPQPLLIAPHQEQAMSPSLAKAMTTLGDLSLQGATMDKALFTIGASWHVNIVVGNNVKGNISCIYRQAPLREVLDAILLANGYSYRAVGNSLVVQKSNEVGSANPLFESITIPVTHGDLDEIVEGIGLLVSTRGQVRALRSSRSILVIDFADRVASIRDFVARLDASAAKASGGIPAESYHRLDVAYFHTQYIPVDNVREPLTVLLSQAGRIATMPEENRLVVVDYPSNIAMVRKVLDQIDRPKPQIRITALIYDVSLSDVEQLGLNWNSVGKGNNLDVDGNPQQAITLDTQTLTPFGATAAGGAFTIQSLTRNFDITAVALLLQNANDSRLLANPNVTVMDNETADMSSVRQIPFQRITQSELGGQIGTTAFKDVGITLHVTPTVSDDGTVKMIVEQEFSRLAGFTENGNQPIIDTRIANTTVRVANRQTLVIGGLRQRSDTGNFNGIPFLKDARWIGPLFRSRDTIVRESELLVFLMPEVVSYDQAPSPRELMAQETLNSRLDQVPIAEGYPAPNGASGAPVSCDLVPLPPIDGDELWRPSAPIAVNSIDSPQLGNKPFRARYDDRYRASDTAFSPEQAVEIPASASAKASMFQRLFGSKQ